MMPLSEILFLVVVFYLLYRFVFNFLVPVLRTTRHVRQQFRNMRNDMGQQPAAQEAQAQQAARPPHERHSSTRGPAEDYIDFEEVKK